MRNAEFTNREVIEAGIALQRAGKNVSGYAIRRKVGGGNADRIRLIWDQHVANERAASADPIADLPEEVVTEIFEFTKQLGEQIAGLIGGMNDQAVKAADQRVRDLMKDADMQLQRLGCELVDAAQTVDDLELALAAAARETSAQTTRLASSERSAHLLTVELAQVRERLTAAEEAGASAAKDRQDAEMARSVAASLRGRLDEAHSINEKLLAGL